MVEFMSTIRYHWVEELIALSIAPYYLYQNPNLLNRISFFSWVIKEVRVHSSECQPWRFAWPKLDVTEEQLKRTLKTQFKINTTALYFMSILAMEPTFEDTEFQKR